MEWSSQQAAAIDSVAAWHKAGEQPVLRVFGYAGTIEMAGLAKLVEAVHQ